MVDKRHNLLDSIFPTSVDKLRQRDDEQHNDFWTFCEKFLQAKKRKENLESTSKEPKVRVENKIRSIGTITVRKHYSRQHRVNIVIAVKKLPRRWKEIKDDLEDKVKDSGIRDFKTHRGSFSKDTDEFAGVLLHYLDFCEKQKFHRLLKLKQEQQHLPISVYRDQLMYVVKANQVAIIAGDTGCGKSTQVPQYLAAAGFSNIACTQPRRLACLSLAKRVAFETLNEYGSEVGYQVRFDTSKTSATKILFLTEGLLLRQLQSDPKLLKYSVIVIDEVHERHLNGDFLLGILKCILAQRKDLKLILMSATINISLYADYFHGSPILQIPGRIFPIDLQYLPHFIPDSEHIGKRERLNPSPYLRVMQLIDHKYPSTERGDLLIFLSGLSEIATVVEAARQYAENMKWIVLPLHSSLSIEEQEKVFDIAPAGVRKCIVSTNIAETSVTIDGVRFICDSGKVKEMSYDAEHKIQRLQEFWISRASAEQRKGRAGRTGPGVCFRLYSEDDYHAFLEYASPEIKRVPLDNLVLQMSSLGLHQPTLFPFIEAPEKSSLENAICLLKAQKALRNDGHLTSVGKMLAKLPVDIVIGKMLIMGCLFNLIEPVLVIAAALSLPSPMIRHLTREIDSQLEHRRRSLVSDHGDPLTLMNIYNEWLDIKHERKISSRTWCKRRGYEEQRFYEMTNLRRQFQDLLENSGLLDCEYKTENNTRKVSWGKKEEGKKRLQTLKRAYRNAQRRKKVLKLDTEVRTQDSADESDDDAKIDIQDIEFHLRHNTPESKGKSVKRLSESTLNEKNMLKLIIASGLFPQVAIPDDSNSWRRLSDQTFHSKDKSFLVLHPSSVFYTNPDFLTTVGDKDIESRDVEILTYVSLLETNKPYIVNLMRMPALQTLLLLSPCLDTNSTCTRIVCDEWLEITLQSEEDAQDLLGMTVQLRSAWETLMDLKFAVLDSQRPDVDQITVKVKRLRSLLSSKLSEFMSNPISCKLRRILSGERGHLFTGNNSKEVDTSKDHFKGYDDPPCDDVAPATRPTFVPIIEGEAHMTKGGICVSEYLTYGSLRDNLSVAVAAGEAEYLRQHYHCHVCGAHLICTVVEKIQHINVCHMASPSASEPENSATSAATSAATGVATSAATDASCHQTCEDYTPINTRAVLRDPQIPSSKLQMERLRKPYFCDTCAKQFHFSATEKLKHHQMHKTL